ncbi:MAG: NAD-dependent epimerase/dehydratase family protein [Ferruginibacter sp.]
MKTFITGATGYIGNQLAQKLAMQGEEINLLVRDVHAANLPRGKNIQLFKGDITNVESIAPGIKGCTHVYHCAAIAKMAIPDRKAFFEVNVNGTKNMLEASRKANIQKFVFTSSAAVFGPSLNIPLTENDPRIESFESDYDFSKHMAENVVREYVNKNLNAVIVNPSRVYGPGPVTFSNAVNRLIKQLLNKKILLLPNIDDYRSNFCYIEDIINGHLLAMEKGLPGENYILGGENISYRQLQASISEYTFKKNHVLKLPVNLLKVLAVIYQVINRHTELTPAMITRLAKHRMLNSEKAIKRLGYCITPFKEGIHRTINHLKKQPL